MGASCPRPLITELLVLCNSLLMITSLTLAVLGSQHDHLIFSETGGSVGRSGNNNSIRHRAVPNATAPPRDFPVAYLNTSWVNREGPGGGTSFRYDDGSFVRLLLVRGRSGPSFACGFFCCALCNGSLFSVFLVHTNDSSSISGSAWGYPQVVWSANRNNPVGEGARLQLTSGGQLVLSDSHDAEVWSTGTLGKSVSGVNLTETGNLVLYSATGGIVWQSFNHATDTVLPGQPAAGQRLVANASATNSSEGDFYLNVTNNSFYAFMVSNTPVMYYSGDARGKDYKGVSQIPPMYGGELLPLPSESRGGGRSVTRTVRTAWTEKFIRLDHDGHLRLYKWSGEEQIWKAEMDLLTVWSGNNGGCIYPTVCGEYGICSADDQKPEQCSCPTGVVGGVDYFQPVDARKPNRGCYASASLSCPPSETHILLPQANLSFSGYVRSADLSSTDAESCKEACLRNCSCKAAFFKFSGGDLSKGDCYLPFVILSLMENRYEFTGYNSSAFIKVQRPQMVNSTSPHGARKRSTVLGSILGGLFALLLLGVIAGVVLQRRRKDRDEAEGCLPHLPGMPTRFSYDELKSATGNFSGKLGEGGFGSVFQGTLADGTMVAVKLLGGKGQGMKEFLAEVETIGSIHHLNLVRLVGYCAQRQHRLLAYEYMCNGSLDKWIFQQNESTATLDWRTRHKIILHVAKGLAYLHEGCRHRIAHLDIKPENILLDDNFNAKISDFGLSKLIDRDQSQVVTTMRGTPGYLAPEWLTSAITEKVDVFSFGVVVLETMCGRRNMVGSSRWKQNITLVDEVKCAADEDLLLNVLDRNCEDIDYYRDEAMEMVRIALWCLQGDPNRRPRMSVVVQIMEGVTVFEPVLDLSHSAPTQVADPAEVCSSSSTAPLASTVSGPR